MVFLRLAVAFPSLAMQLAMSALRESGAPDGVQNIATALSDEKSLVLRIGVHTHTFIRAHYTQRPTDFHMFIYTYTYNDK